MGEDSILAIFLILFLITAIVLIGGGFNNWFVSMEFQRNIEVYFEYADRASDAGEKAKSYNLFIDKLVEYGLTNGSSSVWFKDQPNALLEKNFDVAKSLQKRLNELASMDTLSPEYQYGMRQVTQQEFCWFPIKAFEQAYLLTHGAWGGALTPRGVEDRCNGSGDNE